MSDSVTRAPPPQTNKQTNSFPGESWTGTRNRDGNSANFGCCGGPVGVVPAGYMNRALNNAGGGGGGSGACHGGGGAGGGYVCKYLLLLHVLTRIPSCVFFWFVTAQFTRLLESSERARHWNSTPLNYILILVVHITLIITFSPTTTLTLTTPHTDHHPSHRPPLSR
jgi:hypothetical protein